MSEFEFACSFNTCQYSIFSYKKNSCSSMKLFFYSFDELLWFYSIDVSAWIKFLDFLEVNVVIGTYSVVRRSSETCERELAGGIMLGRQYTGLERQEKRSAISIPWGSPMPDHWPLGSLGTETERFAFSTLDLRNPPSRSSTSISEHWDVFLLLPSRSLPFLPLGYTLELYDK